MQNLQNITPGQKLNLRLVAMIVTGTGTNEAKTRTVDTVTSKNDSLYLTFKGSKTTYVVMGSKIASVGVGSKRYEVID